MFSSTDDQNNNFRSSGGLSDASYEGGNKFLAVVEHPYKKINKRNFKGGSKSPYGVSSLFHSKELLIKEDEYGEEKESSASEYDLKEAKKKANMHLSGNPFVKGNRDSKSSSHSSNFKSSEGGVYFEVCGDELPETKLVINNDQEFVEL